MPLHNTLRTDLSKVNISPSRCNERRSDLVKICSMVDITSWTEESKTIFPLEGLSMWLWQARRKGNRRQPTTMAQLTFGLSRALIAFPSLSQTIQAPFHGCSSSLPGTLWGLFGESTIHCLPPPSFSVTPVSTTVLSAAVLSVTETLLSVFCT